MSGSVSSLDLLVIGGGSGGLACARRAASYGARVALAEYRRMGGTCVNVGCVPKKVMWNAANMMDMVKESMGQYGFTGNHGVSFDWPELKRRRDAYVKRLNGIYEKNLQKDNIQFINAWASFIDSKSVHLAHVNANEAHKSDTITAKHILIATGGKPAALNIPGEEHTITSDGFFELETTPKKVAVIGAGYIAVELAGIFNCMGSETNLFVRGDMALRKFDDILKTNLNIEMKQHGIKVHPGSIPKEITKDASSGLLKLKIQSGDEFDGFDHILVATGRVPLVDGLNLDKTDVRQNPNTKHILVDEFQNCGSHIYAIGDVCGEVELTPMAIAAGRRLADRLFGKMPNAKVSYEMVPTVIFSHPPIGTVGLTEEEAKTKYGEDKLRIYTTSGVNLFYGVYDVPPEKKPKTHMKLVCLKENDKIIGAHVIGMGSDEMMQGFGVAIKMGATKADLDNCVAIHPTAAEEFVTIAPWGLPGK